MGVKVGLFFVGMGLSGRRWDENQVSLRVGFAVPQIPFVVVVGFLSHCYKKDEGERCDIGQDES